MITMRTILCPVDFFPASDRAILYAAGLAANYEARLHLLHVITPVFAGAHEAMIEVAEITKSMRDNSAREMDKLAAGVKQIGIQVDGEIVVGDVYDEIKRSIATIKPELVVMGTHGRRGFERWFMGSTTEKLLRHSPVPLLTISSRGENVSGIPRFRRILVTTDFSDGTADALAYAFSVAQENDAEITLLHVLHEVAVDISGKYRDSLVKGVQEQLDDLVPSEAKNWCEVRTRVETGVPYRIILRHLEDERVDLLIMNIHGKGMLDRALLGSTAERVVRAAPCPVMLIPPTKRKVKRRPRPGGRAAA
jgi:nucleotide-binding universal stress UspA family protein